MPPERVCAWCHKDMDTGERLTAKEYAATCAPEAQVSHAMCPSCEDALAEPGGKTHQGSVQ